MNIFLRYEITVRELDANILTGLVAASRGHRAAVCDWPIMMRGILLRRQQPGFVHMNSLAPGRVTLIFHRIFKFFGYQISSMDQESGIPRISYEGFAKARFGEATVSSADLVFCWGRDDYETLRRLYPKHSNKIVLSGSPRVDLWRPKFSSVYARSERLVEPFVLVASQIGGPLSAKGLQEILMGNRRGGYDDRDPHYEARAVGQLKEGADLMLAYLGLVRSLSSKFPDLNIIVKAHPAEDVEIWRGIFGETERFRIDTNTHTSQLVRESMAVISTGSTVAFEAVLAEKLLISFQPFEMPHRDTGFANGLGTEAKTVGEVHALVATALSSEQDVGVNLVPEPSKFDLSQKVYFEQEQLAAERMVDAWEMSLKTGADQPVPGSIFALPREELRSFFASAFPLLISLFVRGRRLSSSTKKNRKRPSLERKLVKARVREMQCILDMESSVSYRFKGRRGLVFKPRRKTNQMR